MKTISRSEIGRSSLSRKTLSKVNRERLASKFGNKCGYCQTPIENPRLGVLDHFYPISQFPERQLDEDNLVYSCHPCNNIKGGKSPVNENGEQLILNPNKDIYDNHIDLSESGKLKGLTRVGKMTIDFFDLNRRELIQQRIGRTLQELDSSEGYSSAISIIDSDFSPYDRYIQSIASIIDLSNIDIDDSDNNKYLYKLLYANVITAMESYLSETLMSKVIYNRDFLVRYVSTFNEFKKQKIELSSIFTYYDDLYTTVAQSMVDLMYHNISKIKGIYKDTLDVDFPNELGELYRAIRVRHDIVHRNGINQARIEHNITRESVLYLIDEVSSFIMDIESKLV